MRPRWRWGWLGVLAQRLTSALGNLVIPNADRVHRVSNQLAPMEAEGWVHSLRCYEDGRTMYDLGYAREGELMRAAGRLPLGALDSLLRCRGGARPVLVTEGIYWVLGPARIRLPMEEELLGWVEDGHFRATHRFTLLGFAFLELHYAIAAAPKEELLA